LASNTPRLNLYKKDPVADANDTFNIQTMLNDNWDKIDSDVAKKAELDAHLADTATGAHKAKNIAVEDLNNRFTATDVEGVLNELFTFANDGKTSIASVIGSPATSGDTFATLANHIQNAKNKGATNLTNKGVSASGTESLDSLMSKIANVNTGKKWASGTTINSNLNNGISIRGLSFAPSIFIIYTTEYNSTYNGMLAVGVKDNTIYYNGATRNGLVSLKTASSQIVDIPSITWYSDGFMIAYSANANFTIKWYAFE
jgi:hypothetical protein